MENRDEILKLDDSALSACCELEFFKGTGNGGQKRNKTSSAARVRLPEFGVAAEDCTERSQHRNRAAALRNCGSLTNTMPCVCPSYSRTGISVCPGLYQNPPARRVVSFSKSNASA